MLHAQHNDNKKGDYMVRGGERTGNADKEKDGYERQPKKRHAIAILFMLQVTIAHDTKYRNIHNTHNPAPDHIDGNRTLNSISYENSTL